MTVIIMDFNRKNRSPASIHQIARDGRSIKCVMLSIVYEIDFKRCDTHCIHLPITTYRPQKRKLTNK